MKILNKNEARELLKDTAIKSIVTDYVIIERPETGEITVEGNATHHNGRFAMLIADVRNLDLSTYIKEVRYSLSRYLEFADAKELVAEADAAHERDWVATRRAELAKEAGCDYMSAPQMIKTLIDRLARAEYKANNE